MSFVSEKAYKLLVVGDSGVGKSCLVIRFADGIYRKDTISTIGVDFRFIDIMLENYKPIRLQLWDTGGQERFRSIIPSYYRDGNGVLIVFDVTNKDTFLNLYKWLIEINEYSNNNICKILIGNKTDCNENERQVTYNEANEFAKKLNMIYIETSAKESINVDIAFGTIAQQITDKQKLIKNNNNNNSMNNSPNNKNNNNNNNDRDLIRGNTGKQRTLIDKTISKMSTFKDMIGINLDKININNNNKNNKKNKNFCGDCSLV